jgi:ERCC4-related helicase
MTYTEFLKSKQMQAECSGFDVDINFLNPNAFDWQKSVVKWALKKGKCALFEDCGLGKTLQQLMWADMVCRHTGGSVLILAPLAVAKQTKREGEKFGIDVTICRGQQDVKKGINIANYEMLEHFDTSAFMGVVLDESSILKSCMGKTKLAIINAFKDTPYKLCCTATPSPNDFMELGNHAEFLGIMSQTEMLSTFFVHDGGDTAKWRLKGHAENKFFEWVASWACCMTSPADLGFDATGYDLPELKIVEHIVKTNDLEDTDGQILLVPQTSLDLNERRNARKQSINERVKIAAEIANSYDGQSLVWCDLNDESTALTQSINNAVEVKGADSDAHKTDTMLDFANGGVKVLVSKPKIAGWGMNWQNCNNVIFVGLSDSFESYYQAVRRCWRFGQTKPVTVHIIVSDKEGAVKANIERKQANAQRMTSELVKYTKDILQADIQATTRISETYIACEPLKIPKWLISEVV